MLEYKFIRLHFLSNDKHLTFTPQIMNGVVSFQFPPSNSVFLNNPFSMKEWDIFHEQKIIAIQIFYSYVPNFLYTKFWKHFFFFLE